jgi:radical SAM-linked protein
VKLRVRFSKIGKIRFTSHRDVARIWERTIRRVGLPVAYSEGFSPRPRFSFGLALPTGNESEAEYLDVQLRLDGTDLDLVTLPAVLSRTLPAGLDVQAVSPVEPGTPSLQEAVTSCEWQIDIANLTADTVTSWISSVLDADEIVVTRERKGKAVTDDLRPSIHALDLADATSRGVRLHAELGTKPRAVRPVELLVAAGELSLREAGVRRIRQWMTIDGARSEPLPLGAAVDSHARMRAS